MNTGNVPSRLQQVCENESIRFNINTDNTALASLAQSVCGQDGDKTHSDVASSRAHESSAKTISPRRVAVINLLSSRTRRI